MFIIPSSDKIIPVYIIKKDILRLHAPQYIAVLLILKKIVNFSLQSSYLHKKANDESKART